MAEDDDNVVRLRPPGGPPPGLPPLPGGPPPPPVPPHPPAPPPEPPGSGAPLVEGRSRRSAADSLATLSATPPPLPTPPQTAGTRSEPAATGDASRPGVGALGLAATLAITLAAMRGTAGMVQDWRQRRAQREAEAEPLRKARAKLDVARLGTDAAIAGMTGRRGVPSSHDWGRRASGGSTWGGGGGRGRSPVSGGLGSGGSGPARNGASRGGGGGTGAGGGHRSGGLSGGGRGSFYGGPSGGNRHQTSRGGTPVRDRLAAAARNSAGGKDKHGKSGRLKGLTADGRTTLQKSVGDDLSRRAAERLKNRRGSLDTPLLGADRSKKNKDAKTPKDEKGLKSEPVSLWKSLGDDIGGRASERLKNRRTNPQNPFVGKDKHPKKEKEGKEERQATDPPPAGPSGSGSSGWAPPPRGERRSAADSSAWAPTEDTVYTVTRDPKPRPKPATTPAGLTTGVAGLPRAPYRAKHARPGTTAAPAATPRTRINLKKEAPMSAPTARLGTSAPEIAAEHATEVTLDDVQQFLSSTASAGFTAHDECVRLATRARELRQALDDLAADLMTRHNVVGTITANAMAKLADSTEVVARKAEEMTTSSLHAAETAEMVEHAMEDAYRPIQQAAADAGLRTPSARIHNEN